MTEPDLISLLRDDQRERWHRGEPIRVEAYREQRSSLRDDPEALMELIYAEVVLREEAGEEPQLEEYLERFPEFDDQIRLQFEVHRALGPGGLSSLGVDFPELHDAGAPNPDPVRIAGYEVLGELGRGGMGVVYLARQISLKRHVALKVILAGGYSGAKELARFRTEAEAVARLKHPNIAQIYEVVEEQNGRPCLAMELVEGGNLATALAGTPWPPRRAAQLVEILARAVLHVHRQGIIHRDLKPSNVLLTGDGIPKIADFGLAKLLDGDSGQTPSEAFLGTPSYMAPEQASGRSRSIGPLSDIYAIGAILYELLAGRPPFRAETPLDTIQLVLSQDPVPPRRLQPKVPRDLETICLKCLEKEPTHRYPDAGELADDLRRFLAGESIRGRPTPAWRRSAQWARRHPAGASLLGLILLGVVTSVVVGAIARGAERRRVHSLRVEAEGRIFRGGLAISEGRWEDARLQLSQAIGRIGGEDALADLEETATRFLTEAERTLDARSRHAAFDRWGDEVLFRGTQPLDVDAAENVKAAEAAAREALAAIGAVPDPEVAPNPDPRFTGTERAEILSDCYEILLVLADALVQPLPGATSEQIRERGDRSLRILDAAATLGRPTRAYHIRRARHLENRGEATLADAERKQAAETPPSGPADFFLLGVDSFLGVGDPSGRGSQAEAIGQFEKALRLQPDHFWARYYLAVCHLNAGRADLADVGLTACLGQKPGFLWGYLLRGFARGRLNDFESAEADFQAAARLHPNADAAYALAVNRGASRIEQGRFAEADDDLKRAIELKPNQYRAYVNRAFLAKRRRNYPEALQELERAIRLGPPPPVSADLQVERADLLLLSNAFQAAADVCDAVLASRSDSAPALAMRARASLAMRDDEGVIRYLTRYLDRGGTPKADLYRGRGQARMRLGDYAGAADDYTRGLVIAPDREIRVHRGWAYFFAGAYELAIRDFDEAIRLDPNAGDAYIGRGLARVTLGRDRDAVDDAREAHRRHPETPEMLHNLACIYARAAGCAEHDLQRADGKAIAADYRRRAIDAVRATLQRIPPAQRPAFWRDKILPDSYLEPIRTSPEFLALEPRSSPPSDPSKP